MLNLPNEAQLLALFVHVPGGKLLVASYAGDGFLLPEDEAAAQTRARTPSLRFSTCLPARVCRPMTGDHVAVVGENRKLLVFPAAELPEMGRGKGVRLQRYKDGGLADAAAFDLADGLSWKDPAGRMAPRGFPRENRFG